MVGGAKTWAPRYNPLGFFAMFAIGSLAAGLQVLWAKHRSLIFDLQALVGLCVFVFVAYADARGTPAPMAWLDIPYDFPWLVLATGLVLAIAPSSRHVGRVLDNPLSRYIASISFGIYVWHYLAIELARKYWSPGFEIFSVDDPVMFTTTSVVITALSFTIAHLSFHLIEKPIMLWARRREKRIAETATLSPAAG